MAKCTQCGKKAGFMMSLCDSCIAENERKREEQDQAVSPVIQQQATQTVTSISGQGNRAILTGASSRVSALSRRYNDAYLVAKITVGLGNTIKVVGIVLAILIFLGVLMFTSMAAGQTGSRGDVSGGVFFVAMLVGGFYAFITGFVFYFVGVIVSAQGQVLRATLDNTVGNSPFL